MLLTALAAQASDLEDQFEQEIKKRDKKINELEDKINKLEYMVDRQEQYTRRNSIRISGIQEEENSSDTDTVKKLIKDKLQVTLLDWELIGCHRVGRPSTNKTRPILVKLATHHYKTMVYKARSKLKGTRTFINEDLTKSRAHVAKISRQLLKDKKISNCWTYDGNIFIKTLNDDVKKYETLNNIFQLFPDLLPNL